MKNIQNKFTTLLTVCCLVLLMNACTPAGGDFAGSEFMPDMVHSLAYEANYYDYYYYNTWGTEEEYYHMAVPRKPVAGTIPRGYAGIASAISPHTAQEKMAKMRGAGHGLAIPLNGYVPYYYKDTEADRARATAEIIDNPFPITAEGLARGKELYNITCSICHGAKADGNGYLVADENRHAKYPNQPANFTSEDFINSSNGRFYHAIMYGKNVMGSHADKLSYEERWQVIHYIRSLQAKSLKKEYNENVNTFNGDIPASQMPKLEMEHKDGEHMEDASDHQPNPAEEEHSSSEHSSSEH